MTILYLVCADEVEADRITGALFGKRLIACAKKLSTQSTFKWKGDLHEASEVVLLLETEDRLFDEIETEVRTHHSHKTFILASIPIEKTSAGVTEWLKEELKD